MTAKATINTENQYFIDNVKFFESSDVNGRKAFFCLGMYTRRVLESVEKEVAEKGVQTPEQEKFVKRINKEIGYNMSYRSFTTITKLLDSMARNVNPKLFFSCSGTCKQYMINSEVMSDKKALNTSDANMAFSLGLYQH
jgi:thiamine kinase-like enzyme